jgi:hypothetical protein
MVHHMETCRADDDVEWEMFTLLGDDTVFRELFHSIVRKGNV